MDAMHKLLISDEFEICQRIAARDDLHGQRALALLALDEGVTQPEASQRTGLSVGQIKYGVSRFRRERLRMFPQSALEADAPEPVPEADAPEPVPEEAIETAAPPDTVISQPVARDVGDEEGIILAEPASIETATKAEVVEEDELPEERVTAKKGNKKGKSAKKSKKKSKNGKKASSKKDKAVEKAKKKPKKSKKKNSKKDKAVEKAKKKSKKTKKSKKKPKNGKKASSKKDKTVKESKKKSKKSKKSKKR